MSIRGALRHWRKAHFKLFRPQYEANGLAVKNRNLGFLDDPRFAAAWAKAVDGYRAAYGDPAPNIAWRAHFSVWAARHGLARDGDFVECGVNTGMLAMTVCHMLDFASLPRRYYLFDTYGGLPLDRVPPEERAEAKRHNARYVDTWECARRNFASFPNAVLVRGVLPDSLAEADITRIAYLGVDLNSAWAEEAVIAALWDKLADGAAVLIDDYAFARHERQYEMWNRFAAARERMIATLPTGQGLLIR